MPSILDNLRNNAQSKGLFGQAAGMNTGAATPFGPSAAGPAAPGAATDQTTALGQLAAAKSGKAAPATAPAAPAASSLQEQVSERIAAAQSAQLAGQNQVAQAGLTQEAQGEAAQAAAANKQIDSKRLDIETQMTNQASAIIQDFTLNRQKLDMAGTKARAEQLGFNLRLADQKYIQQLQDQGRRARLDSDLGFREALSRTVFDEEQGLFSQDLQFRSMLRADDAQFQLQLGQVDMDFALAMAKAQATQANQTAMWQGAGGLAQTGVAAYGEQQRGGFDSDYQAYKDREGGEAKSYSGWKKEQP